MKSLVGRRLVGVVGYAILAGVTPSGCFSKFDASLVLCTDSVNCPSGYQCVSSSNAGERRCSPIPIDSGGPENTAFPDGSVALEGGPAGDGPLVLDTSGDRGAILDWALTADDSGSVLDALTDPWLSGADLPDVPDVPVPDAPFVDAIDASALGPDAPVDLPAVDSPLKLPGATCRIGDECASAYCVDGVCCDQPCTGQCQACAEPASPGACTTVSGAPRGTRSACTATQAVCAGHCGGTQSDKCTYPDGATICAAAACTSDGQLKTASVCDQAGGCTASSVVVCDSGKFCSGNACVSPGGNGSSCLGNNQCTSGNCTSGLCCAAGLTNCNGSCSSLTTNANCGVCGRSCAPGSTCSGGSCTLVLGQPCTGGGQCGSTYCVDGVCCDKPCAGQCQACGEPSSLGTCITVSGAPRGNRTSCGAAQPSCAGQCNGGIANQCTYPGSGTVCSAATCSSDTQLRTASVCNGSGGCTLSSVSSCGAGLYCTGGACVSQIGNGNACQSNPQCSSGNCSNQLCCAAGYGNCGGSCTSLSTNSNCGSCGRSCASGSSCSGGACLLDDGKGCSSASQCRSGVCTTFYLDLDGDGYGDSAFSAAGCGSTPPAGLVTNGSDCCDSDSKAHPGQTSFFTAADACGSFDYNCNGQSTPQVYGPSSCGTPTCVDPHIIGATCDSVYCSLWYDAGPCGQSFTYHTLQCGFSPACNPMVLDGTGTQACN